MDIKYYKYGVVIFKCRGSASYIWSSVNSTWIYFMIESPLLYGMLEIDPLTYNHPAFVKEQFYKELLDT